MIRVDPHLRWDFIRCGRCPTRADIRYLLVEPGSTPWVQMLEAHDVMRPQRHHKPTKPASRVGVDVGARRLATVATSDGGILDRVANPAPLAAALKELRRLCRQCSRRAPGSRRYRQTNRQISLLHARISNIRKHHIAVLTTSLAKTHGEIVVEGLDASGMLQQKGLNGARARRRGLADAALAEPRRQLRYKCRWYGSQLVEADRFYPSSKTCHTCGHVQNIGWAEHWTCDSYAVRHQRDDTPPSTSPATRAIWVQSEPR